MVVSILVEGGRISENIYYCGTKDLQPESLISALLANHFRKTPRDVFPAMKIPDFATIMTGLRLDSKEPLGPLGRE
jgi:hypothetical protein